MKFLNFEKSDIFVFIRFVLVGALNTVFGMSLYFFLLYIGLVNIWALTLSTILGVLFNFKTIGNLVFKNNDNRLIFRFVACYLFTYCLNLFLVRVIPVLTGLNDYWTGLFVIPTTALVTFFIQRLYVFKKN